MRHKIWEIWEALPEQPMLVRMAVGLLPIVVIVVGVLAVMSALESAPQPQNFSEAAYGKLSRETPEGHTRVLVVGDETAWNLGYRVDYVADTKIIRGTSFGLFGCSVAEGNPIIVAKITNLPARCLRWEADFSSTSKAFDPQVVVLLVGRTDTFDRVIGGQTLRVGTPAFEAMLMTRLELTRLSVVGPRTKFFLATIPCSASATSDDAQRRNWVNGVWKRYAQQHPGVVEVADMDALACNNGVASTLQGNPFFGATGFTKESAIATWDWLGETVTKG